MGTIYVSDLDGTLVNNQAELSPFALRELNGMLADGLQLTVASARSIVSMQQMLCGLKLTLPVICFNGAFVSDFRSGEHLLVNSIQRDVAEAILGMLPAHHCAPFLSTYTGVAERVYYDAVENAGMQWYWRDRLARKDPRFQHRENCRPGFGDAVTCITIINRKAVLDALASEIAARFSGQIEMHNFENQYSPGWYWLTIHDARASKDQAIHSLRSQTGLQASRLVVFGDNDNDVKMFRAADHAVAVENAAHTVKAHAHEVIGSNMQDGVVNYLLANWSSG